MTRSIALAAVVVLGAAPDADVIAVRAGRIVTGAGEEIQDGVILIEGGKIRKVGKTVEIPPGAVVVDASKQVVLAGLVDAGSGLGADNEDADEILPDFRILDALDPTQPAFQRALRAGVTSAFVAPGNRSVIGGRAAVVKTAGEPLLLEDAGLKAAVGSAPAAGNNPPRFGTPSTFYFRRPTTRMGVVWEFRKAFLEARRYRDDRPAARDAELEILARALEGKAPVRVSASRAVDIETAVGLADELGLRIVLEEAQEAWRLTELLAKRKIAVVLRPAFPAAGGEGGEPRLNTFAALVRAGIPTALLGAGANEGETPLFMAAMAVKFGATRDQALRAVTLTPAEILGVADRVGSIAEGKDADLLFLSGDPLDVTSRIERVMVNGRVAVGEGLKRPSAP